jgi:hypothetical protein
MKGESMVLDTIFFRSTLLLLVITAGVTVIAALTANFKLLSPSLSILSLSYGLLAFTGNEF